MQRILIANRGEIAVRIAKSVRKLGLHAIAVYSDADSQARHVNAADEAIRLGAAPAAESYLHQERILEAAYVCQADAIHPGYGFLSENADFAQAVLDAGLIFVGPSPHAIRQMGDKATARHLMQANNVTCVTGYEGKDQSDAAFADAAKHIGYPVMIKAAAGGGGRGMRLVAHENDLITALSAARQEAIAGFGSDQLILEKAIQNARHIECQVLGDSHGTLLHLGERDCSLQRRHQKIIEEAPAPDLCPEVRLELGDAAIKAAKTVDYTGAGTVEFLLDDQNQYYFLEMNTRLQVEHPITEEVTGLDLVALQLQIAAGEKLPFDQSDVKAQNHAIEARICAEDPSTGFLPSTGKILRWQEPIGVGIRVESGISEGDVITSHYDPMLAKIIATGSTRNEARMRLIRALNSTVLFGPKTNISFLTDLLQSQNFVGATVTTGLIDATDLAALAKPCDECACIAGALILNSERNYFQQKAGVSDDLLGWSNARSLACPLNLVSEDNDHKLEAFAQQRGWRLRINQKEHLIEPLDQDRIRIDGKIRTIPWHFEPSGDIWIKLNHICHHFSKETEGGTKEPQQHGGEVLAPLPGKLIQVLVKSGETVEKDTVMAIIEAMKMQHRVIAPISGKVVELIASKGDQLAKGAHILTLEKDV